MAIQIKFPPLSVKAAKKRKKVWIASRHASLAVAMTGTGTAFFNSLLEQFQRKHAPAKAGVGTGFASGIAAKRESRAFQVIQSSPELL